MPFKVIQGHRGRYQSTARMRLPVTDILSGTVSELSQLIVQILYFLRFEPPFGGLRTTYAVHLGLIGKCVVDFLLVLIELFSLGVTAESLRAKRDWKSAISLQRGKLIQNFRIIVSELSQLIYCPNFGHFAFLSPSWGLRDNRTTYDVHLGLIGKRVVDLLLTVFARLRRYERK